MVESEAKELPEDVMLGAVVFGHEQMQAVIKLINELADEAGKPLWDWTPPAKDEALIDAHGAARAKASCAQAYRDPRQAGAHATRSTRSATRVLTELGVGADGDARAAQRARRPSSATSKRRSSATRSSTASRASTGATRARCGRSAIRTGVLPRAHGTALFTRGETQAIVTATLGTSRDEQIIDALQGEYRERFMMHYNFPPYATGETGRVGSPKRREIGHGRLAKRALLAVLPTPEEFAYSLRVVSEITESNGSSSMASVCGGCLALMDAGVPLKAHVAGIAMGLIKEGNRFAVLTDILGDEDHLGDMDFKVAGTENGRDRAADGHQDPGHHQGDHARRARRRRAKAACTSWRR